MKTKILAATQNPFEVMSIAAKTCYSSKSPIDIIPTKDSVEFVMKVLKSGHLSIAEHINFTIAIEGISRACSQQLTRHRHCTFSMQSQRYVNMSNAEFIIPSSIKENYDEISKTLNEIWSDYIHLIENGVKKEDARSILPNCTSCNLVMTTNLRELMHISNLRMCSRSQSEIRKLLMMIKNDIKENYDSRIAGLLIPQCEMLNYCPEEKSCGRKTTNDIKGYTTIMLSRLFSFSLLVILYKKLIVVEYNLLNVRMTARPIKAAGSGHLSLKDINKCLKSTLIIATAITLFPVPGPPEIATCFVSLSTACCDIVNCVSAGRRK